MHPLTPGRVTPTFGGNPPPSPRPSPRVEGGTVLLSSWAPNGGSGTSAAARACALVLPPSTATLRAPGARRVARGGAESAIFGPESDPDSGVADWLAIGPEAPTDALDRLAV